MDIKTLLIATLAVSLVTSLSMVIVFWTRQTYPGFGYWVVGNVCRTLCIPLFLLSREQFPPWLTIILPNGLFFAAFILNNRGVLVFRDWRLHYGWEIAAALSFSALFAYFSYVESSVAARLMVIGVYHGGFALWTIAVLLMRRPAYFGSSDILQAVLLGTAVVFDVGRAGYIWTLEAPLANHLTAQPYLDVMILLNIAIALLLAISQIMMNAQRLEYDYRLARERLELALDGGNIGSYAAHLRTGETFVDERHQRLLGYRPGEIVFTVQNWLEHVHPEDQPPLLQRYAEVAKGQQLNFESEYRVRRRDGTWLWLLDRGQSFDSDETGQPKRVAGTLMDITERKQAEAALNQANEALEEAQRLAKVGSWDWDIVTDTVTWSKELYRILGRDPNLPAPTYQEHRQIYPAESMAHLDAAVKQAIDHGIPYQVDLEFVRPDGAVGWLIGRGEPRYDAHHHLIGLRGTCTDITDQRRIEENLRLSLAEIQRHNARMATLIEMNDLLLSCETRQEAYAVIGHSAAKLFIACSGCLAISRDSQPEWEVVAAWGQAPPQSSTFLLQACWALRLGELHEVADPRHDLGCSHFAGPPESAYLCMPLMVRSRMLGLLHISADGHLTDESFADLRTLVVAVSESIKLALSNLQLREALREQAIRDPLTGLFNRRYLDETLHRELHRCRRDGQPLAVAMLDIDYFKHFNDTYGHEAGDAVLQAVGGLLRQSLRASDIACRYGGEEITLILPGSSLEDTRLRLEDLRQAIQQQRTPYRGEALPVITVSIGLAGMKPEDTDASALLARADAALYQAKAQGRNRIVVADGA